MKESDILYEIGNYWVTSETFGTGRFKPTSDGYRVWHSRVTHSVAVATIGYSGEIGLNNAIEEANKRHQQEGRSL